MKLEMKPLAVFQLGQRKVIQCRMIHGRPQDALQTTLIYKDGSLCVPIRIVGISTAWHSDGTCDYTFEGPLNTQSTPSVDAVITQE
jgi:hypothetical protein